MLEYDRIDISEGIDINKSGDKSKECHICTTIAMNHIFVMDAVI